MLEIQQNSLNKALHLLRLAGAKFAVIDADGNKHGELETAQPPRPKKQYSVPRGFYTSLVRERLHGLRPGGTDVVLMPDGEGVALHSLQATISAYCTERFGAGNFATHRVKSGSDQAVEIVVLPTAELNEFATSGH